MPDLSRIDKRFYLHPKAVKARLVEPGAISLWLFANCFCRDHRRQGFISCEEALELGSEAEVKALVVSGLWREVDGGYQFNDWCEWNPDFLSDGMTAKGSSGWLVWKVLGDHPEVTRLRLAREVEKLIDEGATTSVIEAGLRKWGERRNAPVTWLPYFVSDAIREGETGLAGAIKTARRTWDMSPLAEFGFRWQSPDLPAGVRSLSGVRQYMQERKREWLDQIEAEHVKNGSP